jgi:hypothetical protein
MQEIKTITDILQEFQEKFPDRYIESKDQDVQDFLRTKMEEWGKGLVGEKKGGNPEFETNQDFGFNSAISEQNERYSQAIK